MRRDDGEDVDFVVGADVEADEEFAQPVRRELWPGRVPRRWAALAAVGVVAGAVVWLLESGGGETDTAKPQDTATPPSSEQAAPAPVIPDFSFPAAPSTTQSGEPSPLVVRFPADRPTATVTFDPQLPVLRPSILCPTLNAPGCRTTPRVPAPVSAAIRAVFPTAREQVATTVTRDDLGPGSPLVLRQVVAASGNREILVQVRRHDNANAELLSGTTPDRRVMTVGNSIGGFDLRISVQPPGSKPMLGRLVQLSRDRRLLALG